MLSALGGLVDAEAQGQQQRQADRQIHIGAARGNAPPSRNKEGLSGIKRAWNSHGACQPEEHLPRGISKITAAIPDGVGQTHREHSGETRNRQTTQQQASFCLFCRQGFGRFEGLRLIAQVTDPLQDGLRRHLAAENRQLATGQI